MRHFLCSSRRTLAIGIAAVFAVAGLVAGQGQTTSRTPRTAASTYTPPASTYQPPRTAWGHPDFQGTWDYQSSVPMERPAEYAGKAVLTDAELAEFQAFMMKRGVISVLTDACGTGTRRDERCEAPRGSVGHYNAFWGGNYNIPKDNRTSLIVDPADGRVPPLTPQAQKQFNAEKAYRARYPWASPEVFPPISRCIAENTPNAPQPYNSGTLVIQTPDHVMILRERLDTRIIPLDGRPHIDSNIRQWNGDSRGRWEGNTLVVETTNFRDHQTGGGAGMIVPQGVYFGNFHVTERFVPISATRIHYYATIEDPTTFTTPWTIMIPWQKDEHYTIYEYACHEGNLSIGMSLRGERMKEAAEAKAGKGK